MLSARVLASELTSDLASDLASDLTSALSCFLHKGYDRDGVSQSTLIHKIGNFLFEFLTLGFAFRPFPYVINQLAFAAHEYTSWS